MTDRAVPNLPSRDLATTAAFYAALGFAEVYRSEEWLVLDLGDICLEFFPHPDHVPASSDHMVSIHLDDLDAFYARVTAAQVPQQRTGFPRAHPPATQPWGARVAFLVDPDGTQLSLIQNS